ncbi:transposase IS116/IS110/IS902 family protein [Streptococcus merionis]|uniref:Transposase IS116/IS110/IS902 family protein n=1 Tax=Streptococcus merionis TaxID=400065 RepID=A0A239SMH2_9STRE|nr:hypothetical protein [Streptococcus merionis]SNU86631.1 transposase IS116/IS110/IS902 family protein [Streptococcus merionis]
MDIFCESCTGTDIHQATIVICLLSGLLTSTRPSCKEKRFDTTTAGLAGCQHRKYRCFLETVWHALTNDFVLILTNPAHMKNIKGRKRIRRTPLDCQAYSNWPLIKKFYA